MVHVVKVSIEFHPEPARFAVAVLAKSIQRALSIAAARYPGSVARGTLPIDPGGFSSSIPLVWAVEAKAQGAEHIPRQPPEPVSYWLIAEKRNNRLLALTIRAGSKQETLPIFSSEEEAGMFLRFGGVTGRWRARGCGAGELVSVLSDPCAGVKKVTLDPSPEMVVEGTVGLVSLLRENFVAQIMTSRSGPLRLLRDGGVPGACMAILNPERRTRDAEAEGTHLPAVARRRGEVRA